MNVDLREGERIEDLQYKGLRIIQSAEGFRFGTDSVLLAGFVRATAKDRLVDLGSGTGVIAVLTEARTGAKVTAVEIQGVQCDMARRTAAMNGQEIGVIEGDMRTVHEELGRGSFDAAVCNPPYHSINAGEASKNAEATHELSCTLEETVGSAEKLLKFGGRFFMCCPARRLAEAMSALTAHKLEPKRLRLVASTRDKPPYLALIEAKKGASPGLEIEKQLNILNPDGSATEETNRIYHRENA